MSAAGKLPAANFAIALNTMHPLCHEAADAFWQFWRDNGETHKRGYYESTWGAINRALRMVGTKDHEWGDVFGNGKTMYPAPDHDTPSTASVNPEGGTAGSTNSDRSGPAADRAANSLAPDELMKAMLDWHSAVSAYGVDSATAGKHFKAVHALAAPSVGAGAAESLDAKDAQRYRLLRRGQHWSVIDGIGDTLRAEALDAAIDSIDAAHQRALSPELEAWSRAQDAALIGSEATSTASGNPVEASAGSPNIGSGLAPDAGDRASSEAAPGTPAARFTLLMNELRKRFPDPEPWSASPPEIRLLAMLDSALASSEATRATAWTPPEQMPPAPDPRPLADRPSEPT